MPSLPDLDSFCSQVFYYEWAKYFTLKLQIILGIRNHCGGIMSVIANCSLSHCKGGGGGGRGKYVQFWKNSQQTFTKQDAQ